MTVPRSMLAVRNVAHGGPAALVLETVPVPTPENDQALIEVHAAGVTFPDVLQTRGEYQLRIPTPFTIGCEFAGIVVSAGAVSGVSVGDRVAAIGPSGAFSEYALADHDRILPVPDDLSLELAAGMPMNVLTADFALMHRGGLRPDETVLIHGAAGGLGLALIQRAKLAGARVLAVVSTDQKARVALDAGADHATTRDDFLDAAREWTGGRGVDLVADPVGGDRFTDSLRALATDGRLLVLGFTAGSIPVVKVNRLLLNNIAVIGVGWGGLMATGAVSPRDQWMTLIGAIGDGFLNPRIGVSYPLAKAAEAIADLDERRAVGKIMLRLGRGG